MPNRVIRIIRVFVIRVVCPEHRLPRLARYLQEVIIVQIFSCKLNKLELKLELKLNLNYS